MADPEPIARLRAVHEHCQQARDALTLACAEITKLDAQAGHILVPHPRPDVLAHIHKQLTIHITLIAEAQTAGEANTHRQEAIARLAELMRYVRTAKDSE
jgi:hypothetical protein